MFKFVDGFKLCSSSQAAETDTSREDLNTFLRAPRVQFTKYFSKKKTFKSLTESRNTYFMSSTILKLKALLYLSANRIKMSVSENVTICNKPKGIVKLPCLVAKS
jgi:hypothetical protein